MMSKVEKRARAEFEQACTEYLDTLYAGALTLTRSNVEAEELVQDTYVKAFRFAHKFEWGTNLKAWLFRIQTNTFINNYRQKRHERRYLERAASEPLYDKVMDRESQAYAANPEAHAFSKFFKEDLECALAELPEDFKVVIVLVDVEGFSYKEVAEMIGSPIGTVMSRLHRGRKLLQRELIDHAVEAGIITEDKGESTEEKPTELSAYRREKKEANR
jgi:RNA polymerase sigma-70 factor, ECF subfamily